MYKSPRDSGISLDDIISLENESNSPLNLAVERSKVKVLIKHFDSPNKKLSPKVFEPIQTNSPDVEYKEWMTKSEPSKDHFISKSFNETEEKTIKKSSSKLRDLIKELIENEQLYIKSLENGLKYLEFLSGSSIPETIIGQTYKIFGNIEEIHSFHKHDFFPMLEKQSYSVEKIAELFLQHLEADSFYCYLIYALNKPKSEDFIKSNISFFREKQKFLGDIMGIGSFLIKPIQRLPQYGLILNEMFKELCRGESHMINNKRQIGAICKVTKKLQKFLDIINEAMSLNDIQGSCIMAGGKWLCKAEICLKIGCENVDSNLVGHVNLLHQGKFRKMFQLTIFEIESSHTYKGKLFLFEACLVVTRVVTENRLDYRHHIQKNHLNYINESNKKLVLFEKLKGTHDIEVMSEDSNTLIILAYYLDYYFKNIDDEDRGMPKRLSIPTISPSLPLTPKRNSICFSYENISNTNLEDLEHLKSLIAVHKYFCMLLEINRKFFIEDIPKTMQNALESFKSIFGDIEIKMEQINKDLNLHKNNLSEICDLFTQYLNENFLNTYLDYIKAFKRASKILKVIKNSDKPAENQSNYLAPSVDCFLFIVIDQLSNFGTFFKGLLQRQSALIGQNPNFDKDFFRKVGFVETHLGNFIKNIEENYKLFNMDENMFVENMGIVIHSESVKLNNDAQKCRIFINENGVVCVRIHFIEGGDIKTENYIKVVFSAIFNAKKPGIAISQNKKMDKKLSLKSNNVKYLLEFDNLNNKKCFYEKFIKQSEKF